MIVLLRPGTGALREPRSEVRLIKIKIKIMIMKGQGQRMANGEFANGGSRERLGGEADAVEGFGSGSWRIEDRGSGISGYADILPGSKVGGAFDLAFGVGLESD